MLQELSESRLNIISTGGNVNSKSLSFQGTITKDIIRKYNVDMVAKEWILIEEYQI